MSMRVRLPLVNDESVVRKQLAYIDQFSKVKPERKLGAVWTSDLVSQRKAVNMCEMCWRRYRNWWKPVGYHPDWGCRYIGDCDGCSTHNIYVTLFHAEETFYTVLTSRHGLLAKP